VFMKDMDKDTRILMGSRVLDVRRLPDKVARGEEDAKQAFCFLRGKDYEAEEGGKKQGKEVTGKEEIQQIFRAEVL
nr:hypothetical protein [Tanacetum cinerariifolium]